MELRELSRDFQTGVQMLLLGKANSAGTHEARDHVPVPKKFGCKGC